VGYSEEKRQQFRDEVLVRNASHFKAFGETLAQVAKHGQIVVLGSADAIEKANAARPGLLEVRKCYKNKRAENREQMTGFFYSLLSIL